MEASIVGACNIDSSVNSGLSSLTSVGRHQDVGVGVRDLTVVFRLDRQHWHIRESDDLLGDTAEQNGFFGVPVFLSNSSVVADNTLSVNVFGIFAYGTSESTVADNDSQNNAAVGFALEGGVEPTVQEPVEAAELRVPELNTSQNNVVVGNDFSESGAIGMGFIGPSETYVADNDVSDIPDNAPFPVGYPSSGLYLDESSNNVIVNNDASRINGSGGLNGTGIVLANSSSFVSTTWPRNTSVYQESLTSSGGPNGPRTPLSIRRVSTIVSA